MRVVAGSAKGVRLGPVPKGVRPVSDMAREGLFSSLGARVPGARVLDLFVRRHPAFAMSLKQGQHGDAVV